MDSLDEDEVRDDWTVAGNRSSRDISMMQVAREMLTARRRRSDYLPADFFGEPAWDMLLDLYIAHHEGKLISVSSACIASGGSATTALRWLARLETLQWVTRISDDNDRRRIYVRITDLAEQAISSWIAHLIGLRGD
ncbi:hypothetical protein [Sphingobium subterraneum]|uniref:MarR family transcriptional regulator n=1 Tax=Sphingobium subterraneum TaxID=627688 RepID=A0A841J0W9_9SPHN|nr:hypothetical protein [Sphingobium subterraneum]MBB6123166.1 hypothetical protein [Sphingobium subterraneum]